MLNGKEQRDRGGRRPLLATFAGNNRQMLIDIRDSLSHLRKNPSAQTSGTPEQNKPEQAQGASNHTDRTAAGAGALGSKMGRFGYNKQALAQIRADLSCYKHEDSTSLNGLTLESAQEEVVKKQIKDLVAHGYDEDLASKALKLAGPRGVEGAIEIIQQLQEHLDRNGLNKTSKHSGLSGYNKVTRKPSFDEKYRQGSPVSVSDSIRSSSPNVGSMQSRLHGDSPRHSQPSTAASTPTGSANTSTDGRLSPPPPLPPRSRPLPPSPPQSSDPPPPIPPKGELKLLHQPQGPPGHVQQMIRRMSNPAINHQDLRPHTSSQSSTSSGPVTAQRAVGPISKMVSTPPQSLPVMSHQLSTLTLQPGVDGIVPVNTMKPPPPYTQSPQARHSPTVIQSSGYNDQMMMDYRAPPLYDTSTHSSGSSSPASMGQSPVFPGGTLSKPPTPLPPKPEAMRAWGAKQPPIIMQSVKSREVQKPILQTATVPVSPQIATPVTSPPSYTSSVQAQVNSAMHVQYPSNGVASLCMPVQPSLSPAEGVNCLPLPPRSNVHIEIRRNQQQHSARTLPVDQRPSIQVHIQNNGMNSAGYMPGGYLMDVQTHQPLLRKMSPDISTPTTSRSDSPVSRATNQSPISMISTISTPSSNSDIPDKPPPPYLGEHIKMPEKHRCTSPIPERRPEAKEKDEERRETFVRNYSPQAFKFYMEQHVENVLKSYKQRVDRRVQLEREMAKVGLPEEAQCQMRRMLHQKESNYIRLKRAKMDKAMFEKIKDLGIGAFGEVALVRKKDSKKLFAMKTLRKRDVLLRNQVAHVKAERDILAEADNEWVVKLYFSFQDRDSLYFIMDYIPGGDMMSLLIKFGIFQEELAQFYIAELVLAIESVHKMGFIHRDIKPDNILIDKDGHIKLTDFGLCTGFRWTHNSKYYQKDGHCRQDSMDIDTAVGLECDCTELLEKRPLKPLERRKRREQHQRCLAHSLVGTPNYIAPEVLLRSGYTASCDWWSVGVILYEMLVGQPPFLAKTPAETQYKVINWNSSLRIPREANLTGEAEDLILKFICDASHRLGSNQAGEIKTHPFFKTIQFEGLRHREAMYKPQIKYATDTSNFDPVEPDRLRSDSEDCDSKLDVFGENGKHQEHAFFEFTFRRFFDDGGHALASAAALAASSANAAETPSNNEANSPVYV